jgi:hypothetical protein
LRAARASRDLVAARRVQQITRAIVQVPTNRWLP